MTKLKFKSFKIRKAPGFRDGLTAKGLDELAEDVNIIIGPNGAGKTTIARIIYQLLWPKNKESTDIEGVYTIDKEEWSIYSDPVILNIQKNGVTSEQTGIPPIEFQEVYMLALHELIEAEDKELAEEIFNAISGGFNVNKAKKELNYSADIRKRGNISENLRKASDKLEEINKTHSKLKRDEDDLTQLKSKREEAKKAGSLKNLYEKALQVRVAKEETDNLKPKLETFPSVLKNVVGDELERIIELDRKIQNEKNNIAQKIREIDDAYVSLDKLSLPEEGIDEGLLNNLENKIQLVSDCEKSIKDLEVQCGQLEKEEKLLREKIINIRDIDSWKGVNLEGIAEIEEHFHETLLLLHKKITATAELEELENDKPQKDYDNEKLNRAINSLSIWLKEAVDSNTGLTLKLFFVLAITSILTVFFVHFFGPVGFIGLGLMAGILAYSFTKRNKKGTTLQLKIREEDFIKTGLTPPVKWETEYVTNRLDELIYELAELNKIKVEEQERALKIKGLKERINQINSEIDIINSAKEKLLEKFKTFPDYPKSAEVTISPFFQFIESIKKWQSTYLDLETQRKTLNIKIKQKDQELNWCNNIFKKFGRSEVKDAMMARTVFSKLRADENARRGEKAVIKQNKEVLKNAEARIEVLKNDASILYNKFEVEYGELEKIRGIVFYFEEYKELNEELKQVKIKYETLQKDLMNMPFYQEHEEFFNNSNSYDIKEKLQEYEIKSHDYDGFSSQITKIQTLIDEKKKGAEIEEAIAEKQNAENELENLYRSNLSSITGFILSDFINKKTENLSRPEVLKKADEIFCNITRGRYNLRVVESNYPSFLAIDNVTKQGQSLDTLSTGTRVQLLLAARLAFVETFEKGVKLPIIADELLANSDDNRADAIIDALCEISKRGRQVFYFTAQPDERRKWEAYLSNSENIKSKVIELGGLQKDEQLVKAKYEIEPIIIKRDILDPGNMNMAQYRKELGIKAFDLINDEVSALSISFLTDDVKLFINCLKLYIDNWGQLYAYYEQGGKIENLEEQEIREMKNKAELLSYFKELYMQGRSKHVSIDEILTSGIISEAFEEQVNEKLIELEGDPVKLIKELDNIPRFRNTNKIDLENYLIDKGYIDEGEIVSEEELKRNILLKTKELDLKPEIAQNFINALIN